MHQFLLNSKLIKFKQSDLSLNISIINSIIKTATETGKNYDGIILDEGGLPQQDDSIKYRGLSYVVWNPSQIKSADPVTYDDSGNIVPLTARFNTASKDIRSYTNNWYKEALLPSILLPKLRFFSTLVLL